MRMKWKGLISLGYINEKLYEKLRPNSSTTPRPYGLPKIHKNDSPIWPIVAMTHSPYQAIAQYVIKFSGAKPLELYKPGLLDSSQIVSAVESANLLKNTFMSLDAISLCINVSLLETERFMRTFQ